ncbi:MAG: adenine phosphoribosyltransferase [Gilvibacter sp.]
MNLKEYVRDIEGFPKEGVNFKDITPLLSSPEACAACSDQLYELAKDLRIDTVVGVESRGFFFGVPLAIKLGAGFVPVRKPGKLPYKTIAMTYDLEYGTDILEIHQDAIMPGDRVLLHDDVLATGGTAKAVCELIEELGGEVVQCNFIMELSFLNGNKKLANRNIKSIFNY